ncbi:MAG: ribosome-associated translation inhibitor RaiA [Actinomycetota bacterium]|nr:ribosome-associated translation inhibitor RaiA [Actinomycetota bacterium]
MEVSIQCRHVDVPDSLRTIAREKVNRLARHLDGWDHAEIHFSEERNPRIADREVCEVTMRGHGHVLRAKAAAPDTLAAVDKVISKLEHQMEKLRTKLIKKPHAKRPSAAAALPPLDDGDDGDDDERGPRIVKSKRFDIKPMTPEEAALQMDLVGHDFYFFTNADTGVPAVVYRRQDGDLGLIDAS